MTQSQLKGQIFFLFVFLCMCVCVCIQFNLSNRVRQGLDNLLMCRGHHTLPVNLYDPVTNTDPTSLSNAPSHQTAYLKGKTHTEGKVFVL